MELRRTSPKMINDTNFKRRQRETDPKNIEETPIHRSKATTIKRTSQAFILNHGMERSITGRTNIHGKVRKGSFIEKSRRSPLYTFHHPRNPVPMLRKNIVFLRPILHHVNGEPAV
jgi:hypothetical protein